MDADAAAPVASGHEVVGGSALEHAAVAAALEAARARTGAVPGGRGEDPLGPWRRTRRAALARTPEATHGRT